MEDEIDIREYVLTLVRHWRLIVGLTLAAAVMAFAVSSFLPKQYAASATIAITNPRYVLQFDPRIETVTNVQINAKAYLGLATSDAVLAQLLEAPAVASLIDGNGTLENLRRMLAAKAGGDPSLVVLTVTDTDPARAAAIANAWAELYVAYIGDVYGQNQQNQTFFETQVTEAAGRLKQAEADLVAYQAINSANVIDATLKSRLNTLTGYLNAQQSLELVIQDATSLRPRLATQDPTAAASMGDDLAALLLEVNSLSSPAAESGSSGSSPTLPIQLQLPGGATSLSGRTVSEQIAYLDELVTALRAKSEELQTAAEALKPEILSLQQQLAAAQTEEARVTQVRDLAQEAYTTVARKAEEAGIAAASGSGDVSLASRASVPTEKVGPKRALITALAGAVGLMLSVVAAFGWEWWKGGDKPTLPVTDKKDAQQSHE